MMRQVTTFIQDADMVYINSADYTNTIGLVMVAWPGECNNRRYGWISMSDATEILYGKGDTQ